MATPPKSMFANRTVLAHRTGDAVIVPIVGGAVSQYAPEPAWTIEGIGGYVVVTQSQLAQAQEQLAFFEERQPRFTTRMDEIDKAFAGFHADNVQVWKMFLRFTHQVIQRGFDHYSADAIVHRIRWHVNVDTRSEAEFKINNNFVACYARMFHDTYPEHAGFFRTRERTSKERKPREEDDHASRR
jgi:hypothetical protein